MLVRTLPDDCVLVRTPAGARKMRDRAEGLAARLRSVLFIVDGTRPVRQLLDRAGTLGGVLESQFLELIELGLVECRDGKVRASRIRPPAPPEPAPAERRTGIIAAKLQLLDALERTSDTKTVASHAGAILDARTWSDLAQRTRAAAVELQDAAFWARAKQILVASRDGASAREAP